MFRTLYPSGFSRSPFLIVFITQKRSIAEDKFKKNQGGKRYGTKRSSGSHWSPVRQILIILQTLSRHDHVRYTRRQRIEDHSAALLNQLFELSFATWRKTADKSTDTIKSIFFNIVFFRRKFIQIEHVCFFVENWCFCFVDEPFWCCFDLTSLLETKKVIYYFKFKINPCWEKSQLVVWTVNLNFAKIDWAQRSEKREEKLRVRISQNLIFDAKFKWTTGWSFYPLELSGL